MKELALELLQYVQKSTSPYKAVETAKEELLRADFQELLESEYWDLEKGGKYFITKNSSSLIAFELGEGEIEENGFKMIVAHTDSPTFKIKQNAEIDAQGCIKLNTEPYGGSILSTWLDRPLGISGRVVLKSDGKLQEKLIDFERPLLIIPNLSIHFNRSVNEGYAYNPQTDMLPILSLVNEKLEEKDYLQQLICDELKVQKEDILEFDLFLYEYEKGNLIGMHEEFISCARLDDLWMTFATLKALLNSEKTQASKMMILVDNEEVGSTSEMGAESAFIPHIIDRISIGLSKGKEDTYRALSHSIAISADLAHAAHPNYVDKHDITNKPLLGKGPVIKFSAAMKYATTAVSAGHFILACEKSNIPYQKFVKKSDIAGGSTIGPTISSKLAIPVIDVGTSILGMHSTRELGSVDDNFYVIEAFKNFYGQ